MNIFGMFGIEIAVTTYLCSQEFERWRKNHRKSRINKKWHKRYGFISRCVGNGYRMGNKLVCCPCMAENIRKGLAK